MEWEQKKNGREIICRKKRKKQKMKENWKKVTEREKGGKGETVTKREKGKTCIIFYELFG